MSRVLVTGATGRQGAAVVRHLLGAERTIRVLVRKTESGAAGRLAQQGCEVVQADLDDPDSLKGLLEDVAAAFLVLPLSDGPTEIRRGRAFIQAAQHAQLRYLLFSAALDASRPTGVGHFDSKHQLISDLSGSGLHHSVLGPGGFMENLLFPQTWKGLAKGRLLTPFRIDVAQALVAVEDIGRFAARYLLEPPEASGAFVPLYSECLSTRQQADIMSSQFERPIRAARLPWLLTRIFLGSQLTAMFSFFNRTEHKPADNSEFLQTLGTPTRFTEWLKSQTPPEPS